MSILKLLVHHQIKNSNIYFWKNNKNVYVAFADFLERGTIINMGEFGTKKTEVINNFKNAYSYNEQLNYQFLKIN